MEKVLRARIAGTGMRVPDFVLTNDMLAGIVDTSDEWIVPRTGISERRMAVSESALDLASDAARAAMESAGMEPGEVGFIICATVTSDYIFPAAACFVQERLGVKDALSFDISAGCCGFVYALELADMYIRCGKAQAGLVIGCEIMSRVLDYTDRTTCILNGDGAGAVAVRACSDGRGVLSSYMSAECDNGKTLAVYGKNYMPRAPFDASGTFVGQPESVNPEYMHMNGRAVFEFAVGAASKALDKCLDMAGLGMEDVDMFLLHQANKRIIDAIIKKYGLPEEKVPVNINKYGNTSAATIPILLHEAIAGGRLKEGDVAAMAAFATGLTYGGAVVRM